MLRRGLQLVVEQTLVEDADVFRRQVGEVHRDRHPRPGAGLPDADRGPGEQPQHLVDVPVRERLAFEAGGLEDREGAGHAVLLVAPPRREQLPAVGGHREVRVVRAVAHQREQREHPRPGGGVVRETAAEGGAVQSFEQAVQAVAGVVERIVPR